MERDIISNVYQRPEEANGPEGEEFASFKRRDSEHSLFGDISESESESASLLTYADVKNRLHEQVLRHLRQSVIEPRLALRKQTITQLFNDLTRKVASAESQLAGLLPNKSLRYYEILADFYEEDPERIAAVEDVGLALWDNFQFQVLRSLINYKWLFKSCTEMKSFNIFIRGVNKLFWLDLDHGTKRFNSLFLYLRNDVLMSTELWNRKAVFMALLEVFNIASKFYFFYVQDDVKKSWEAFISATQTNLSEFSEKLSFPQGHSKVSSVNMFVNEVVRIISVFRSETIIITYLKSLTVIGNANVLGRKTHLRLNTLLMDLASPGAPFYPTRLIRDQANSTLDVLFPRGKLPRDLVHLIFRLLHPKEAVKSWYYWSKSYLFSSYSMLLSLAGSKAVSALGNQAKSPLVVHITREALQSKSKTEAELLMGDPDAIRTSISKDSEKIANSSPDIRIFSTYSPIEEAHPGRCLRFGRRLWALISIALRKTRLRCCPNDPNEDLGKSD